MEMLSLVCRLFRSVFYGKNMSNTTMSQSLYRVLIDIELVSNDTFFSNLNAKSVDFPFTGEVVLLQTSVICNK